MPGLIEPQRGDGGHAAGKGPGPRLVPVPVAPARAPDADDIDEALDDLVATVDDLVRDLEDVEPPPVPHPSPAGPYTERAHSKAFTVAVFAVLIVFEFVVLAWLLSNL